MPATNHAVRDAFLQKPNPNAIQAQAKLGHERRNMPHFPFFLKHIPANQPHCRKFNPLKSNNVREKQTNIREIQANVLEIQEEV